MVLIYHIRVTNHNSHCIRWISELNPLPSPFRHIFYCSERSKIPAVQNIL
uniref:Uncharacterized protein n=1 Tax=Siphoviridae sp. ctekV29 TaxID=2826406 RepID=A0A8S5QLS1_9CAUD|nr:MAG TPA: hypothetical protein [Siphoviridae sp. ctekV29]